MRPARVFEPCLPRCYGFQARARRCTPGCFCSVFRSKFKAPEMPPSHGLTGLGAIESVAKPAQACSVRAAAETGGQKRRHRTV